MRHTLPVIAITFLCATLACGSQSPAAPTSASLGTVGCTGGLSELQPGRSQAGRLQRGQAVAGRSVRFSAGAFARWA